MRTGSIVFSVGGPEGDRLAGVDDVFDELERKQQVARAAVLRNLRVWLRNSPRRAEF